MKNEKIALTAIEKEKLSACVALAAKNFELKRLALEKALDENERDGRRYDNLLARDNILARIEHFRDSQSFFETLEQKVAQAIKNNQL